MMNDQQQDVVLRRSREQAHAQDGPSFEIKRPLRFLDQADLQLVPGPARGVDLLEMDRLVGVDLLHRWPDCTAIVVRSEGWRSTSA